MQVSFELNRNDFKAFNDYVQKSKKPFKHLEYILVVFVIIIVIAINIKNIGNFTYMLKQILSVLTVYFVFMLIWKPVCSYFYKFIPMKDGGILGDHTISVSEEGITETTNLNTTMTKWKGVLSLESNTNYIFIFIDTHMAHIIPKRIFKSKEEYYQFHKSLEERFQKLK